MLSKNIKNRVYISFGIIVFVFGIITANLFKLQILNYNYYIELAQGQHSVYEKIMPRRGELFIKDIKSDQLLPLAVNQELKQVYVVPKNIEGDKEEIANKLAEILEMDQEKIFSRINKENDPYESLKHRVSLEKAKQIEDLNIEGVGFLSETARYYPAGSLASHLTGFLGIRGEEKVGQYGLEGTYEKELRGQIGSLQGGKDVAGRWISQASQEIKEAQDGLDLVLTIDQNIQFKARQELQKAVDRWQIESGTVIVSEPSTGAILAMASWPDYDPNNYSEVEDIKVFLNPATQKVYEPGSVMKSFTMAAGLDSKSISADDTFFDEGFLKLPGGTIRNVNGKKYKEQTMSQILEESINTGSVYIQQQMTEETFRTYLENFGFGYLTGIDLSGELKGSIVNLFTGREIDLATASFGQGISVTPIQLTAAINAVANDGVLMSPYLVSKKISEEGEEVVEPKRVRQVISSETAHKLAQMLVQVVEKGHGRSARVEGYNVAGKTGTAEVPKENEAGYSEETIHTFLGFAPAFHPRFSILVKLDKPQGIDFSSATAAPLFGDLADYLFDYLEIPPTVKGN